MPRVHFERAGMHEQAFRAALNSARTAAKLSSHREAFELYRRAVDNMSADLPPEERAGILLEYFDEAAAIEENDLAERLAGEASDLFLEAGRPFDAARSRLHVVSLWRREGHPVNERIAVLREAISEFASYPESSARDEYLEESFGLLGWAYMDANQLDDARAALGKAIALAEGAGLEQERLVDATGLGMIDVVDGKVDGGLEMIRRAAGEARARGWEASAVTAYRDAALMALRSMRYPEAASLIGDARPYADAIEQSHCARIMASIDGVVAWAAGDWDAAEHVGEQSLADHGHGRAAAIARWALGYVAAGRGQRHEAERHLGAALDFGRRAEWLEMILPAAWGLAEAAFVAGDADFGDPTLRSSAIRGSRTRRKGPPRPVPRDRRPVVRRGGAARGGGRLARPRDDGDRPIIDGRGTRARARHRPGQAVAGLSHGCARCVRGRDRRVG